MRVESGYTLGNFIVGNLMNVIGAGAIFYSLQNTNIYGVGMGCGFLFAGVSTLVSAKKTVYVLDAKINELKDIEEIEVSYGFYKNKKNLKLKINKFSEVHVDGLDGKLTNIKKDGNLFCHNLAELIDDNGNKIPCILPFEKEFKEEQNVKINAYLRKILLPDGTFQTGLVANVIN